MSEARLEGEVISSDPIFHSGNKLISTKKHLRKLSLDYFEKLLKEQNTSSEMAATITELIKYFDA